MRRKLFFLLFFMIVSHVIAQVQVIDTLVSLDTYQLHFKILKGAGTPILFESGNGDDASVWQPILADIHKSTGATLITYDRAGLGKSEIDTTNISFQQEIKNLETALKQLGHEKGFFLVAHSYGGFYASLFAHHKPERIKGAVFIDVVTPCFTTKEWATNYRESLSDENWKLIKEYRLGLYYALQKFPEIADYMTTRYLPTTIPLTLLVAENLPNENTLKTAEDRKNWVNCFKELGKQSHVRYIVASGADHHVWRKKPKLVIREISEAYKRTQ